MSNVPDAPPDPSSARPSDPAESRSDGSGAMFDRIAGRYDLLNLVMTGGLDRRWRRRLVEAVVDATAPGDTILDLATGTADIAREILLRGPGRRVLGVDPSAGMLTRGAAKLATAGVSDRGRLLVGDGQLLPCADNSMAAACCSFGIRNVPDRLQGLRELARVVRPGGLIAILEASEPRDGVLAPLARWHLHRVVPRLGRWLAGDNAYAYLERSVEAFPGPEEFSALMRQAGLVEVHVRRQSFGVAQIFLGRSAGEEIR